MSPPDPAAPSSDLTRVRAVRARFAAEPADRIAARIAAGLAEVEARVAAGPALDEARKLCAMVAAVGRLVASDLAEIQAMEARGRAARAELEEKRDAIDRERSHVLGWAGTIAARTYRVESARVSGEHPVPSVEALLWEQAALEHEEDRTRDGAEQLSTSMRACELEIARHDERHEHELLVVNACLEGRVAALRALGVEAWLALAALRGPGR
jgi:hypothetical protein